MFFLPKLVGHQYTYLYQSNHFMDKVSNFRDFNHVYPNNIHKLNIKACISNKINETNIQETTKKKTVI